LYCIETTCDWYFEQTLIGCLEYAGRDCNGNCETVLEGKRTVYVGFGVDAGRLFCKGCFNSAGTKCQAYKEGASRRLALPRSTLAVPRLTCGCARH
jgi:hypothetical protein